VLVDTLGLIWALVIQPAGVQDADGCTWVLFLARRAVKRLRAVFVDGAYRPAAEWAARVYGWRLVEVPKPAGGFRALPKRWIDERTFAWLNRWRRLSKDYEQTVESSKAFVYTAMIHLMLKRLTR
jgi:putative transposase